MPSDTPKFCQYCGGKMKYVKDDRPWQGMMKCPEGHVADLTYGDVMGGAEFVYIDWIEKPKGAKRLC